MVVAARVKNWRLKGCCCGGGCGCAAEAALALMGRRGLSLEVGVNSVGEAITVFGYGGEKGWIAFVVRGMKREVGLCHVGLSPYLNFSFMDERVPNDIIDLDLPLSKRQHPRDEIVLSLDHMENCSPFLLLTIMGLNAWRCTILGKPAALGKLIPHSVTSFVISYKS